MSCLTIETQEKQQLADQLVHMMMKPTDFSEETLKKELNTSVKRHIDRVGPYKADRRCCKSCDYVEIFDAGAMGRGVRAKRTIWANTHIGCYTGVLRKDTETNDSGEWRYNYEYGLKGYHIDASPTYNTPTCMMGMINHSEKEENVTVEYGLHEMPDGRIECHIVFVAKRAIMRTEELFIDYGPDYWKYAKKMGIMEYGIDARGNKYAIEDELNKKMSVLRIDDMDVEEDADTWPYQRLSPFQIETGQRFITDYMIRT